MDLQTAIDGYLEALQERERQIRILGGDYMDIDVDLALLELGIAYANSLRLPKPRYSIEIYEEERLRLQSLRRAVPANLRHQIFERDGFKCTACGSTENLAADHVIPFSKGGPTVIENLATLCRSCNSKKGARV